MWETELNWKIVAIIPVISVNTLNVNELILHVKND